MANNQLKNGWIKVSRKLAGDPELWLSEPFSKGQAWVDLLLLAEWDGEDVHPGTVNMSMRRLADRWKWSNHKVARFLDALDQAGSVQVEFDELRRPTILLRNWGKYQGVRPKMDNDRPTKRPTKNIYIRNNKEELTRSAENAEATALGWKTTDERVPEEYRADFDTYEAFWEWRNQ